MRDFTESSLSNDLSFLGMTCQIIDLLFLRLDHSCCKDSTADWQMLCKCYKTCRREKSSLEWTLLQKRLLERKGWWPKYHFATNGRISSNLRNNSCSNEHDTKLAKYKTKIARYLDKSGTQFIGL